MSFCARCGAVGCQNRLPEKRPDGCPTENTALVERAFETYTKDHRDQFHRISSAIEKAGYGEWTRVREVVEFSKEMGFRRLGVAFCVGLRIEAGILCGILESHGFEVISVVCKVGCIPKEAIGVPKEMKLRLDEHESMCNPICQALYLNEKKTDFNLVVGLCVGHDSLFYKYSEALATSVVTKDRVLAHNPVGALYQANSYYKNKL